MSSRCLTGSFPAGEEFTKALLDAELAYDRVKAAADQAHDEAMVPAGQVWREARALATKAYQDALRDMNNRTPTV